MTDGAVTVAAPAKINLSLHVVGRRDDGYHLLESLVAFADIYDTVRAAPSGSLALTVDGPSAGDLAANLQGDNLVLRAARALAAHAGIEARVALHLHKVLPVASGIGGGSADAAAALEALRRLWSLAIDDAALAGLALSLGADVPVCLASRTAYMSGIGERVTPAPGLPPFGVILVNPRVAVPTADVFRALNGRFGAPGLPDYRAGDADSFLAALNAARNDLEMPARIIAPLIGDALIALRELPAARLVRMSGSGATCFALFDTTEQAKEAAAEIARCHPRWWTAAGRLIGGRADIALAS